jgi:alkanesulfonate monooxygenase SsuD/methylene tetrahydromethanopterin reductase-like flavin-dependent oxidoreductase (luciferase family)
MNSLLVGVGVADRAAPGDDPVADAATAEALGYDFVSAFDHPVADAATAEAVGYDAVPTAGSRRRTYPTYETWTLLTWIAARTTQIAIMPRVLGVPFRRPVLVAKAAEPLHRLSGGRLILGLGAGYRDTEIRAVGAPALTPRARADGLTDALAITRAAWMQPAVSYHGAVYSVDDLDLEPKPAQPIPIWLGALGPAAWP